VEGLRKATKHLSPGQSRVSENRELTRIFGPKKEEVTGECRKLNNEALNNLYSFPCVVMVISSRRIR
jgi:hypothetical protein